jgi:hypothetical protein
VLTRLLLPQVVQEVARSRAAIVICGTYCVAWDCFARWPYRAVPRIATSRKQSTSIRRRMPTSQHVPIIPSILNYASGYTPSAGSERLLEILHENRSALAGDARDKIFGTLGLMADITPYMHLIDYSRSIPDVYTTFARQILRDTKSFRILSAAGLSRGIPRHALPSWVPDWSHVKSEAPLGLGKTLDEPFNAGGRSCNIHRESSVNTLSTTGVQVAIITGLGLETVLGRDGRLDVDIMYSWNHLFETTCGTRSSAAVGLPRYCKSLTFNQSLRHRPHLSRTAVLHYTHSSQRLTPVAPAETRMIHLMCHMVRPSLKQSVHAR